MISGDERLFNEIEIFTEKIAGERCSCLQLQRRPDGVLIKPGNVYRKLAYTSLHARVNCVDDYAPGSRDIR